jgi:hypothetical protein
MEQENLSPRCEWPVEMGELGPLVELSPDDVVRTYMRVETSTNRAALLVEMHDLLDSGMSEAELETTLAPWDTFRPKDVEITIHEWLERSLRMLPDTRSASPGFGMSRPGFGNYGQDYGPQRF